MTNLERFRELKAQCFPPKQDKEFLISLFKLSSKADFFDEIKDIMPFVEQSLKRHSCLFSEITELDKIAFLQLVGHSKEWLTMLLNSGHYPQMVISSTGCWYVALEEDAPYVWHLNNLYIWRVGKMTFRNYLQLLDKRWKDMLAKHYPFANGDNVDKEILHRISRDLLRQQC